MRQNARLLTIVTTIAAVLFVTNLSQAADLRSYFQDAFGPVAKIQKPVQEVGLLALAERVRSEIRKVTPPTEPTVVITAVNDEYVEYSSLNLAMRYINNDQWSEIQFQTVPWGSTDFNLGQLLQSQWFLTKRQRSVIALQGDIWTSMQAMDSLITNPESPLHNVFEKRLEAPVEQPEFGRPGLFQPENPDRMLHETVTLWRLTRQPTPAELARGLHWVEPSFRNTPGHDALLSESRSLDAEVTSGNSLDLIDVVDPNRTILATDESLRNISFNDNLRLLEIVQRPSKDGIELDLEWESLKDQILDTVNFIHLLDGGKNIVAQYDYKFDELQGRVKKGDVWRKVIHIPKDKLNHVVTIGLGVTRPPSMTFLIDHGPTDWDGHRLILPVAGSLK